MARGGASKFDRIPEKPDGVEGLVVRGLKNLTVSTRFGPYACLNKQKLLPFPPFIKTQFLFYLDTSPINLTSPYPLFPGQVTFASQHHYTGGTIRSWKAPYTNVMYTNLVWLRNQSIINAYTKAVVDSGCIYGNRWGKYMYTYMHGIMMYK